MCCVCFCQSGSDRRNKLLLNLLWNVFNVTQIALIDIITLIQFNLLVSLYTVYNMTEL